MELLENHKFLYEKTEISFKILDNKLQGGSKDAEASPILL